MVHYGLEIIFIAEKVALEFGHGQLTFGDEEREGCGFGDGTFREEEEKILNHERHELARKKRRGRCRPRITRICTKGERKC